MMTFEVDEARASAVWLFTGKVNTDDDYARYVESLTQLRARARTLEHGTGLLFVDRENPAPNATWRRRMAEASADWPPGAVFVLISDSVVIRGIATAINWLRPATYELTTAARLEEGLRWLRDRRDPAVVDAIERAYQRCQRRAAAER